MKPLRIVFAGTPAFAVPSLQALLRAGHDVRLVLTQPDRPAGRGRKTTPSAVKRVATAAGVKVEQPAGLRSASAQAPLHACAPDLMVVVAYGLILPAAVLVIPKLGCLNVHASLLPRWRGAAPIQRAILAGDERTGVSIMQMDAGLDTGDVLARRAVPIAPHGSAGELHDELAVLGAGLLVDTIEARVDGRVQAEAQDESRATYADKLHKGEAALDWSLDSIELERRVCAFNPWPVAFTRWNDTTLRIWRAHARADDAGAAPGTVVHCGADGIDVAAGRGTLRLLEVQRPGARVVAAADFAHAVDLTGRHLD